MVSILKHFAIEGVEIIPCRLNGPRGIVKSFLICGDERLILVDTGYSDADADIIMKRIGAIGRKQEDLNLCILTHCHSDHVGGLKKLRDSLNFQLFAHELEIEGVKRIAGADVDGVFRDGDSLVDCGGVKILHMPGHTKGSISLYLPRIKTLIAGDTVFSAGEHLIVSPAYLSDDPERAEQSVQSLLQMNLDIERVLVGHGDDVYEDGSARLGRILLAKRNF
ncbi:MAG: MBL fold metallo-hydrolase [Deltaproteobacteria bacterium]|nr:MBL fold metallo-hydrolase [Deltaproteobacteria bacterium]